MTKEELLREEVKRLQNKQKIFWTVRRKHEIYIIYGSKLSPIKR